MQLKFPFDAQIVGDRIVAVPVWKDKPVFEGVVTLNDTGAYIFKNLNENITEQELTSRVMKNYGCSEEDALSSVQYILKGLRDADLLED